jgi:hypothetical protein
VTPGDDISEKSLLADTSRERSPLAPGEGTWSVFAEKVVAERDAARALAHERGEELLALKQAVERLIPREHYAPDVTAAENIAGYIASLKAALDNARTAYGEFDRMRNTAGKYAEAMRELKAQVWGLKVTLRAVESVAFKRGVAVMQATVAEWLRTVPRAGGVLIPIESSNLLALLADDVMALPAPEDKR